MSAGNVARHRAARRPVTPLTEFAQSVGSGASRRVAVMATAGGLIVSTLGAPVAQAAPSTDDTSTRLSAVDLDALTTQARAALAAAPAVTVASEAQVQTEVPTAEGNGVVQVTPAPPPPAPRVVETRTATASRTADRVESAPTIGAPAPDFANGSAVVEIAMRYVGVPYVSGGTTPDGFDCSGLTQYVYAQVGISLPRSSSAQRNVGTVVSRADAQPGDLVWTPGHVAIYAGNGMQVDAPRPGKTVQLRAIWQSSPTFIRLG